MCFKFFRVLVVAIFFFSTPVWSQPCEKVAAVIESMEGGGVVKPLETERWQPVKVGHQFCYGDTFKVEKLRAVLRLENDTLVKLNSGSVLKFVPPKESFWVELVDGVAHFISRTPKSFTVKAPYVNAAVEGTEFIIAHKDQQDTVSVVEGLVVAENTLGSTRLQAMQQSTVVQGGVPSHALVISLPDVADWSLYYPPVYIPKDTPSRAAQLYSSGDFSASYQQALADNDMSIIAALSLFYGQRKKFEEAVSALNSVDAQALFVIQKLVQGGLAGALLDSNALVDENPNQPSALLAQSYALQANFELDEALKSAQKAQQITDHPLIDLRVAELALIVGRKSLANENLNKLERASFFSVYSESLRALTALQDNRNKKALTILEGAAIKNASIPLVQLLTGLTQIQRGDFIIGREKLELAVTLDPSNSLYRSYLGKAYAEEGRMGKAEDQIALAKELDSDDPTPWFYDGLNKQSYGAYGAAISAYEKSLELNNQRNAFRSKGALAGDAAVKSANIGTSYSRLGLDKKAAILGSKIVAESPGAYAGHRLLLEAYADDPQQESLRATARLNSTLMQPLGVSPLPVGLLESGLNTIAGASPSDIGISEYTNLFIEDGVSGRVTLLGGGDNTNAYDFALKGKWQQLSLSLGDYRYQSDGVRENNDADYRISSGLIHYQPTNKLNFQFEYSQLRSEEGDLSSFDPDGGARENYRSNIESHRYRVSGMYTQENSNIFIINMAEGARDKHSDDFTIFNGTKYNAIGNNFNNLRQFNGQYVVNTVRDFTIEAGVEIMDFDSEIKQQVTAQQRLLQDVLVDDTFAVDSYYMNINTRYFNKVEINVGLDYTRIYREETSPLGLFLQERPDKFLPYVGLQWEVRPELDVRAAYSENYSVGLFDFASLKKKTVVGFSRNLNFSSGEKFNLLGFGVDYMPKSYLNFNLERLEYDIDRMVRVNNAAGLVFLNIPITHDSNIFNVDFIPNEKLSVSLKLIDQIFRNIDAGRSYAYVPDSLEVKRADLGMIIRPSLNFEFSISFNHLDQALIRSGDQLVDSFRYFSSSAAYYFMNRKGKVSLSLDNITGEEFDVYGVGLYSSKNEVLEFNPNKSYALSVTYNF